MTATRRFHTATLLNDDTSGDNNNNVLITGGFGNDDTDADDDDDDNDDPHVLKSAEYYNPVTRQFSKISGLMSDARRGHTAVLLEGGNQGYLRVESTEGLLFSEIYNYSGASASINGINVDKYAGITKLYSPQFVITRPDDPLRQYDTLLNIINGNQDSPASITLTLHASDGRVLSSPITRMLSINAQIKGNLWDLFNDDPSLRNQSGWLEIASSVDRVVATVSITNPNDDFHASFELSGTPMGHFLYPLIIEDSRYQTGISLLNSGDQTAGVHLELWGPEGTLDAFTDITLAPHANRIGSLSDLFPGMQPHQTGNVRIISSQPLHSFATMYARDLKFISSLPPVLYPE
jgi:hypothetical protein